MVPAINYWAVIVAGVAGMAVGAIWYSPRVFGNYWMKAARVEPQENPSVAGPMIRAFIATLVSAWVLAGAGFIAWGFYAPTFDPGRFLPVMLLTATVLWAGFTLARLVMHDGFEGRPLGLTLGNAAHDLVSLLIMAVVLGWWRPLPF